MPVVAESPPLIFGQETPSPTPTPAPAHTPTPEPAHTPTPAPTARPTTPTIISPFVTRHEEFIRNIDFIGTCFKREELPEFSDQEFADHSSIAIRDKYIVKTGNTYCSMQGVHGLVGNLRRAKNEQEII